MLRRGVRPETTPQALEKQTRQKEADDELALLAAMIEGAPPSVSPSRLVHAPLIFLLLPHVAGVPDQGQAFEPAKGAAKDKTKKQPGEEHATRGCVCAARSLTCCVAAFPTASLPKPVKSSAKGKGGGGGDGGKEGGKGRKMYFD